MDEPPPAPPRVPSRELIATGASSPEMDRAEADIVKYLQNALESASGVVRAALLRLSLAKYNEGLASGRRSQPQITAAYLAVLHRKLGRALPRVYAREIATELRAHGWAVVAQDVTEGATHIGLPLAAEEGSL